MPQPSTPTPKRPPPLQRTPTKLKRESQSQRTHIGGFAKHDAGPVQFGARAAKSSQPNSVQQREKRARELAEKRAEVEYEIRELKHDKEHREVQIHEHEREIRLDERRQKGFKDLLRQLEEEEVRFQDLSCHNLDLRIFD